MGVKSIFKILISVPMLIVAITVFTEYVNVSLQSQQLKNRLTMGAEAAANLFEAENYKNYSDNLSPNESDITDESGTKYVTGEFYPESWIQGETNDAKTQSIYKNMYSNSDNFKNWVNNIKGYNSSIGDYSRYLNEIGNGLKPEMPNINNYETSEQLDAAWKNYNSLYNGYIYYSNNYTPLNLGCVYFDKDVLLRMTQWEMTRILSSCDSSNIKREIVKNTDGTFEEKSYVYFQGFGAYVTDMKITELNEYDSEFGELYSKLKNPVNIDNITYATYDLSKAADREALEKVVHIDATQLGLDFDNIETDDRRNLTIAVVKYSIPISYNGITPIRSVMSYANSRLNSDKVDGIGNASSSGTMSISWNVQPEWYSFVNYYYSID